MPYQSKGVLEKLRASFDRALASLPSNWLSERDAAHDLFCRSLIILETVLDSYALIQQGILDDTRETILWLRRSVPNSKKELHTGLLKLGWIFDYLYELQNWNIWMPCSVRAQMDEVEKRFKVLDVPNKLVQIADAVDGESAYNAFMELRGQAMDWISSKQTNDLHTQRQDCIRQARARLREVS